MHQGRVRAFLVRLCKQYDDADDLAQETFIIAFRKLESYKGTGSFSGWLFRIAYNCFLQQRRSVNRRDEVTDDFVQQYELITDKYESISAQQIDLERAIAQLNHNESAAISLCYSYGYSHQEASVIMQLPLGTVKSNISRGKAKLRDLLTLETEPIDVPIGRAS